MIVSDTVLSSLTPLPHTPESVMASQAAGEAGAFGNAKRAKSRRSPSRLQTLPPYIFAELDAAKERVRQQGVTLIDLGMGNHDRPTPKPIMDALREAIERSPNHQYPQFKGCAAFRQSAAHYVERRFKSTPLDPDTQIQPLIGSKEGITHLILAYSSPGDIVLMPALHYPAYLRATLISGATPWFIPLDAQGRPKLDALPEDVLERATLLLLNFPNNPSSACVDRGFWQQAISIAKKHDLVLVSDMAYGEITFTGSTAPSLLAEDGGADVGVEFYSCSKSFNMAGWRIGFAAGSPEIIEALFRIKSNMDYGVNTAIQEAAAYAMDHAEDLTPEIVSVYHTRRNLMVEGLNSLGWHITVPQASFYLWVPTPDDLNATQFSMALLNQTGIVVTPGVAFGEDAGRHHVRISLVQPEERLREALERLHEAGIHGILKS
jgi:LL-diaminopimelate aminotransferase